MATLPPSCIRKCRISSRTNSTLSQVKSSGPSDFLSAVVVAASSPVLSNGETIVDSASFVVDVVVFNIVVVIRMDNTLLENAEMVVAHKRKHDKRMLIQAIIVD